MAFPEAWMNELMNKNEIVSVISEYTHLAPKGGRLWGLCPFHPERQASFSVSPDKQLFHCFSCKAGGSVIQFVMQAESLPFVDAVRFLAQRVGMSMPDEVDDERLQREKALRDRLYNANRDAAKFYCGKLFSDEGRQAREYLLKRGIDGKTAASFGLGYSPDDWDALFRHMTALGYTRDELIAAGLVVRGRQDDSRTFDFFRGRLMFPVINERGSVLAFGGRTLEADGEPKYMNTGDTLIYNKKHNVYAINMMKGKKLDELIMVEGYMDVISLHQHGIDNAVASLGTALTGNQARLMGRFAKRVMYAYDGDAAGQRAMLRGVDILSESGVEPRVIVIPGGQDPDEYVREFGREAFLALKDSSITAVQFKLESILRETGTDTADGRQRFATDACALLSRLEPVERDRYVRFVSEKSGVGVDVIREQCGVSSRSAVQEDRRRLASGGFKRRKDCDARSRAELLLLSCLLASREEAARIEQLAGYSDALFASAELAGFLETLRTARAGGREADMRLLVSELDSETAEAVSSALSGAEELVDPLGAAEDCIKTLERERREARIRELSELAEAEPDPKKRRELIAEQMELMRRVK